MLQPPQRGIQLCHEHVVASFLGGKDNSGPLPAHHGAPALSQASRRSLGTEPFPVREAPPADPPLSLTIRGSFVVQAASLQAQGHNGAARLPFREGGGCTRTPLAPLSEGHPNFTAFTPKISLFSATLPEGAEPPRCRRGRHPREGRRLLAQKTLDVAGGVEADLWLSDSAANGS